MDRIYNPPQGWYALFVLFFFSSSTFSAATFDEVVPVSFAFADFANDPGDVVIPHNTNPVIDDMMAMPLCEGMKGRQPSTKARTGACPAQISGAGPNKWRCYAETETEGEDICYPPAAGSMDYGLPVNWAICPPHYKYKNLNGGGAQIIEKPYYVDATNPGQSYNYDTDYIGAHCERCAAPFEWDAASLTCKTQCPIDQEFDQYLGMCVEKKDREEVAHCEETDGNPVYVKNGEKQQFEEPDYLGAGEFPLVFSRNYKSYRSPNAPKHNSMAVGATSFKSYIQPTNYKDIRKNYGWNKAIAATHPLVGYKQWRHNYDARINLQGTSENAVIVVRPDGKLRSFTTRWGSYYSKTNGKDKLAKVSPQTVDAYWYYYTPEGNRETYNQQGRLVAINTPQGLTHTLSYTNGLLTTITDSRGRSLQLQYDVDNRLSTLTSPAGDVVEYSYDNLGNLTKITFPDDDLDPLNNPSTGYVYDDLNHPLALTGRIDAKGNRVATWVYDLEGRVIESKHINNNEATFFSYQGSKVVVTKNNGYEKTLDYVDGRLVTVTGDTCASDGTKGVVTNTYNTYGYVSQKLDAKGSKTVYGIGARGLPNEVYEGFVSAYSYKRKTSYVWHTNYSLPTQVKESALRTTDYSYDADGKLLSEKVTTAEGFRETTYQYHINGLLASTDGSRTDVNDVTQFGYHTNGDLATITNALGQVIKFNQYDAHGRVLQIEDPNGVLTNFSYDARGRLTQLQSGIQTINYVYDGNGNLIQTNDGNQSLSYEYDNDNRLQAIVDDQGNRLEYTLDSYGNITNTNIVGSGQTVLYTVGQTFDKLNRLEKTVTSGNHQTSYEYDVGSDLVKTINPLTHVTQQVSDGVHRVTKITDPLQGDISFTYDRLDNITSVTAQNGKVTNYTYNGFGEVTRLSSPDTGLTTYTYDLAGNLTSERDARNITVNYQYDALNRLIGVTYPDTSENVLLTYDNVATGRYGIGRLTSAQANGISYQYHYNSLGQIRLVETNIQYGTLQTTANVSYGYTNGLLTEIQYPSGAKIQYSYSSGNVSSVQLETLDGQGQPVVQNLATNISYLPFGGMTGLTYGNSKSLSMTYDLDYLLTGKTVSGVIDKSYLHNPLGDITSITDTLRTTENQSFNYDELQRLTSGQGAYGNLAFAYDSVGNRTSKTVDSVAETYQYTDNQLTNVGGTVLGYDATGNLTTKGSDTFAYNKANRLSTATVSGIGYHYRYDHNGQRVVKDANGQVRFYHYDANGLLLAETDQNGNSLVEYIYLNGQRLAIRFGQNLYYVHTNHLDAPLAISAQDGSVVWQAYYTPFGEINVTLDNLTEAVTARFPGQYADNETGFYYNYFRDYDPEIGRYIQSDPIGLLGGINTYAYVGGNPVGFVDPTGESATLFVSTWITSDAAVPEPTDAIWVKWAVYGLVLGGAWTIDWLIYSDQFMAGLQNERNPVSHGREIEILSGFPGGGCDEIEAAIRDLKKTINWRKADLNPVEKGTANYVGHVKRIKVLQDKLKKLERQARENGCNPNCN